MRKTNLDDGGELMERRPKEWCFEMGQIMVFGPGGDPAGHTPGLWDGNRCKKDRKQRQMGVYWFAAERQNGNSG
jgi:hypothetical protein